MQHEPFILSSVDRAQTWVDLCSKGLQLPAEKSASMLCSLCGFGSWDVMAYAISSMSPSPADEELEPEQYRQRLVGQIRTLVKDHDLDIGKAIILLASLSPTSRKSFAPFSLEEPPPFTEQHELAMRDFAKEHVGELLEMAPPGLFDSEINQELLQLADPVRAEVAIALSAHTAPDTWLYVLRALGWEFDYLGDEHPDLDEPSVTVFDEVQGEVPIYLAALSWAPVFDVRTEPDRTQRLQQAICVGDYMRHWKGRGKVALLLNNLPVVKVLDGKLYCHLGCAYQGDENCWTALLFNLNCTSVHKLLELNSMARGHSNGWPGLADEDGEFSQLASICLSGFDPTEAVEMPEGALQLQRVRIPSSSWMIQSLVTADDDDEFE